MLTVQAVGTGRAAYHSSGPGCWWGAAAARLGVSGAADGTEVAAVLAGRHPRGGERLPARRVARRRAGWEVVVAAPKSVSLLAALAGEQAGESLAGAHNVAAAAALSYLEGEAARCRRGGRSVPVEGLVAVAYDHRANAAGEPHLHTHLLVANLAPFEDRWLAVDGRYLFWLARPAGALYHLVLRDAVRRAGLDFEWRIGPGGMGDVAAVPVAALEAASSRRARMLDDAADRTSRAALEVSRRRTRPASTAGGWRDEVAASGFGPSAVADLLGRSRAPGGSWVLAPPPPGAWGLEPPAGPGVPLEPQRQRPLPQRTAMPTLEAVEARLIERGSHFRPADVLPALAEATPGGLDAPSALRRVREVCERATPLAGGVLVSRRAVEADRAVALAALARQSSGAGVALPPAGLTWSGAAPERLSTEVPLDASGRRCAEHLVTSGDGVEVLGPGAAEQGRAPMVAQAAVVDAARLRWQAAGHSVAVVTRSASAAARWEAATGLTTRERTGSTPTVLIVDRADRCSTPELGSLLADAAADGTKVILVEGGTSPVRRSPRSAALAEMGRTLGRLDPGAGPSLQTALRAVLDTGFSPGPGRLPAPQRVPGPAGALGQERCGFRCDAEVLARWDAVRLSGEAMPLMVAAGPAEAAALNGAARTLLAAGGTLSGEGRQLGGLWVRDGERVVALRRQGGIRAGTLGHVSITTSGEVALHWEGARRQQAQPPPVAALGYGYATTPSYLRPRTGGPSPPDLLVRGDPARLGVDGTRVQAAWRVAPAPELDAGASLRRGRAVERQGRMAAEQGRVAPFAGRGIV